ncbi:YceD family protein, partial [Candidatus Binatus sp.]
LCREDCRGLCPHCGVNLNRTTCGCRVEIPDPRMDAIRSLKLPRT